MNSSKNKILLLVIAILLVSNIVMLAFMFGSKEPAKNPQQGKPFGGLSEYLKKDVGFSEEQAEKFEQMRKVHRANMRPIFDDLRSTKVAFYLQLQDSTLATDSIISSANRIGEKQKNLDIQIFNHFKNIRSLCTPQQRVKFDSIYPSIIKRMTEGPRRNSDRRTDSTQTGAKGN